MMIRNTTARRWLACLAFVVFSLGLHLTALAQQQVQSEIEQIRQAISEKNLSWTPRESRISRLPLEERLKRLGEEPYTPLVPGLQMFEAPTIKTLPSRIDWRHNNGNWVTPVRDQGSCGSCWAFAATAVFESAFLLQQNTPGIDFNRSEQMVLSCSGAGTCSGGFSYYALQYISSTGVADEGCFPYVASDVSCNNRCSDWASRSFRGRRILGVANNTNDIRAALQNGPTTISFDVYTDFHFYGSGVYEYSWGWNMGGHAVTLVGYDSAIQAWLCKNSWDDDWGEDGYFWIRWGQVGIGRSVYILERNRAPEFNPLADQMGAVGQTLSFYARASDPEGDAITYSMTSQPAMSGASINSSTGLFSWTPGASAQGAYSVTFTARDNWNPALSTNKTITVAICPASCDDGNPCTTNSCNPQTGQCVAQPILDGESCSTGQYCLIGQHCSGGFCVGGSYRNCAHLDDQCNVGVCDESIQSCRADPASKEGYPCDDGAACTTDDRCEDGICVGTSAIDCSHLDDQCNVGVCSIEDGSCYKNPIPFNGLACDNGKYCTLGDVCDNGTCVAGVARDCSHVADQCSVGVCNEVHKRCDALTAPKNGHACDDGLWCTLGEYCQNGLCAYGTPRDCTIFSDQCSVGACDEANQRCYADPTPKDGTFCDDGRFCTVSERCQSGVCTGGDIRACSSHTNQCNVGVCNLVTDSCFSDPTPKENMPCNDGLYCTVNETCQSGVCVGEEPRDCSHLSNLCNTGVCDEAQNTCKRAPLPNGTPCEGEAFCTVNETCHAGVCAGGQARDCSHLNDACNLGMCSNTQGACYAVSDLLNGAPCDDGLFCTTGDFCDSGTCRGSAPRNCSHVVTVPACQVPHCNEEDGICEALPANEGDACDDGLYCTVDTVCQAGACMGDPRDCSVLVDEPQCQSAHCEELGRRCLVESINDQQACSTGDFCLVGERCVAGACMAGQARDCSVYLTDPHCQSVVCDSEDARCDVSPANEGLGCSSGNFCIVNEACEAGICQGGNLRDCSGAVSDPQCQEPFCDETASLCSAIPINEGLACSDGNPCTRENQCQSGVCVGEVDTCDDGVSCTIDTCNPETGECEHIPDPQLCHNTNECTVDTCDPLEDCQHTPKADWTLCQVGQAVLRVCLAAECTEIRVNDRCVGAFPLFTDLTARLNLNLYHSFWQVTPPCAETELSGPDAFYSFYVDTDEPLDLVLEYEEGLDVRVFMWNTCESGAQCTMLLASEPETRFVWTPLEPGFEGKTLIFQVVAPDLPDGWQGKAALSIRTEGWEFVDGDIDEDEETDPEDGDIPDGDDVDGDEPDGDDGDGDEPDGDDTRLVCEPGDRTCAANLIMECRADGRGWDHAATCRAPQFCEDGECRNLVDGDLDDVDWTDGDTADGDLPEDGDLDLEPVEPDGDDDVTPDEPEPGTGGGGCRQITGAHWPWLLLAGLWLARRQRGWTLG